MNASAPSETPLVPAAPQPRRHRARSAMRQMIGIGAVGLCGLAILNEHLATGGRGPLWRVFVGIAAFLFLWRLAALTFDLVFVWHRYIQGDAALRFLRREVQRSDLSSEGDTARNATSREPR